MFGIGIPELVILTIIIGIFYYFKYYRKQANPINNISPIKVSERQKNEYRIASINNPSKPCCIKTSNVASEHPPMEVKNNHPLIRKHAKPELDMFLNDERQVRIIFFDLETNGLYAGCSVLSCSAIKYNFNRNTNELTEINRFDRYYYPIEQFNTQATDVNGLTRDVIKEKRETATYPEHFRMDSDFETFCGDTERFVAHNISFDMQFIPRIGDKIKLCTMMTNMNIVAVEYLDWKKEWKWPKLSETANFYCIPFNLSSREIVTMK